VKDELKNDQKTTRRKSLYKSQRKLAEETPYKQLVDQREHSQFETPSKLQIKLHEQLRRVQARDYTGGK
jgi:hypothetical protein